MMVLDKKRQKTDLSEYGLKVFTNLNTLLWNIMCIHIQTNMDINYTEPLSRNKPSRHFSHFSIHVESKLCRTYVMPGQRHTCIKDTHNLNICKNLAATILFFCIKRKTSCF